MLLSNTSRPRKFLRYAASLLVAASTHIAAQSQKQSERQTLLEIQQHIEQNDLDGARQMIDLAAKRFPNYGGLENLHGVVEIQQHHPVQARRDFTAAIQHDPSLVSAYLNLGRLYTDSAESNKADRALALSTYQKLLRLQPQNPEANYQIATLLLWDEKYQQSLDHLARLPAEDQQHIGTQLLLCADHAALNHVDAASAAAGKITAHPDLSEQDAMQLLPTLRTAHRADLIEEILTAAGTRHSLSANGLRILGLAQEANGRLPEARATLEQVYTENPSSEIVLVDLARIAKAANDYQGALGYLAHARALHPDDASLPYEFGVICVRLGLIGEARKAMGEAVKLAPNSPEYNYGMGTISSFAQDPTGALPYLEKYHSLRPADPSGLLSLGTTYFRAKNFDAATSWLNQAKASASTAADAHYYLGRIALQQDHLDQALLDLEHANTLAPGRADILTSLGQAYQAMKKYPEAKTYLQQAIALDKDNYQANFALLQLFARTNDEHRAEQSKRFDEIKDKDEQQYKEMMRIIEVRPNAPAP
jgi:tetratricopeptide (TPR) repeat protein